MVYDFSDLRIIYDPPCDERPLGESGELYPICPDSRVLICSVYLCILMCSDSNFPVEIKNGKSKNAYARRFKEGGN